MKTKDDPNKLVGEVQILRIRVATAESEAKVLRDQALQAKRRRKEAKRMSQRARKQFKRFKSELSELQQTLAKAEAKLFQAGGGALAGITEKASLVARRGTRLSKKSKTLPRKPRSASPRTSSEPGRVARKNPPTTEAKVVFDGAADSAALDHTDTSNPQPQFANL
jgi:chromosome segregation ATPase